MEPLSTILIAVAAFLVAGSVKGLTGLGLPTVSIGLMTLALDPRTAIALVLVPMLFSNLWQYWRAEDRVGIAKRYWVFAVVLCLFVWLTTLITKDLNDRLLLGVLGAAILVFVIFSFAGWVPHLPDRFDRVSQVGFGFLSGIIGGLSAAWAAPLAMYLSARGVEKDEFVGVTGFLIVAGSVPLLLGYAQVGHLPTDRAMLSVAMIVPTLLGFTAGEALRKSLSPALFRRIFLILFAVLGANLLRRAIWYV